jgi:hypothetical protein
VIACPRIASPKRTRTPLPHPRMLSEKHPSLRADCKRCFALCCVVPAFSASADFAINKDAGHACPNLQSDFRWGIHTRLRQEGFPGCTVYDCFGAGQKVSQVTFGGQNWRRAPRTAGQMFEVFPIMRQLSCQAAGLVVIDLDGARGQQPPPPWDQLGVTHGRDVLRILAQRAGAPDPIDTYTVATPAGQHRYFLAPTDRELRNTTGQTSGGLGWCIDTRGAVGAIIAAGSVRRIEGRPRRYRVVRDVDPVALPRRLVTALTPPPVPVRFPIRLPSIGRRLDAYVAAALAGEAAAVTQAAPGTRAHALFCSAARLGELVGAGFSTRPSPPRPCSPQPRSWTANRFTRREALGHITNGIARGSCNPRQLQDPTA